MPPKQLFYKNFYKQNQETDTFFYIYKIYSYPFYKNIAAYIISPLSVKDERDILIVEDNATTRSASLLYDEAFFIFVIITIDFPQQHLFSRRS